MRQNIKNRFSKYFFFHSVNRSVGGLVRGRIGGLVRWTDGRLVGQLAGRSVRRLFGRENLGVINLVGRLSKRKLMVSGLVDRWVILGSSNDDSVGRWDL